MRPIRNAVRRRAGILQLLFALTLGAVAGRVDAAGPFTVGDDEPLAAYTSIAEALAAAAAETGDREIQIAAGHYPERLEIAFSEASGSLTLSGGWNADFSDRSDNPAETVIDASKAGPGRVVGAECDLGRVTLAGLTLTGGRTQPDGGTSSSAWGGGLRVRASGSCVLRVERLHIVGNVAEGDATTHSQAGGVLAIVGNSSRLEFVDSRIEDNLALNDAGAATSGGMSLSVSHDAVASLVDNWVIGNTAQGGGGTSLGGLRVDVSGRARAIVHDSVVARNVVANTTDEQIAVLGVSLGAGRSSTCEECVGEIEWRRNRVEENAVLGPRPWVHAEIVGARRSRITLSDSIFADSPGDGVMVLMGHEASLVATNLTIADNELRGLLVDVFDAGRFSLANSILFGNGVDTVPAGVVSDHNLAGIDPLFENAAAHDYSLRAGSPAIDAGNDLPEGGLGTHDVDGRARISGAHVDIGAHERAGGTSGGVPCQITDPFPPPHDTPLCTCLSDPTLREIRCAFFGSDLFVTVARPWPLPPGDPFIARWTLQPWRGVEGPYKLRAALVVDGEEIDLGEPQGGPKRLIDGKLTGGKLVAPAPEVDAPLRSYLEYWPAGEAAPRSMVLDALLRVGDGEPPELH